MFHSVVAVVSCGSCNFFGLILGFCRPVLGVLCLCPHSHYSVLLPFKTFVLAQVVEAVVVAAVLLVVVQPQK